MAALSGLTSSSYTSVVSALMEVERRPLTQLQQKEKSYQTQLSSLGKLKSTLAQLTDVSKSLQYKTPFSSQSVETSSNAFTVTSSGKAELGQKTVEVQQLAKQEKLQSNYFADANSVIGTGTLTLDLGKYSGGSFSSSKSTDISVGGTGSLSDVKDAVNVANAGVTASIVSDVNGSRLVLKSNDTGESNAIRLSASDNDGTNTDNAGLSQLTFDKTGTSSRMQEVSAAQNAKIKLDGVQIESTSNELKDVTTGISLKLNKTTTGEESYTVSKSDAGKLAIENMVKQYNASRSAMKAMTAKGGEMQGDGMIRMADSSLTEAIRVRDSASGINGLFDLGITTQRDGSLAIDSTKLTAALADSSKDVAGYMSKLGESLTNALSSVSGTGGSIPSRETIISGAVKGLSTRMESMQERLDRTERTLQTRFANLEKMLQGMNSTASQLNLFSS